MAKENNKFKKDVKVKWKDDKLSIERKNKKKNDKLSMKKQIERKCQPIPRTVEEWQGHRGIIEYQMCHDVADSILALRKGKEKGIDPQKWLCDYINDQEGLIGYCVKVVITG